MLITIITPTFNSRPSLPAHIASVNAQTYPHIEHLFIDNASSDGSVELITQLSRQDANFRTRIISEKDSGISDAFNKGLVLAQGEVIGILNSDDQYTGPQVLAQVAQAFGQTKNLSYLHGNLLFCDPLYGPSVRRPLQCPLTTAMPFNHPTLFVHRRVYQTIGHFDLTYRYAMDFEWVCRLLAKNNPPFQGEYLPGPALVQMQGGGASWKFESQALAETRRALQQHQLWNTSAAYHNYCRLVRIWQKHQLEKLNISAPIVWWRKRKWKIETKINP